MMDVSVPQEMASCTDLVPSMAHIIGLSGYFSRYW